MIPAGVALFFLGIGRLGPAAAVGLTAAALAFSAGTFLCIALSDLLPELQFHAHDRLKLSAALLAGFVLMAAASAWEGPEPPRPAPDPRSRRPAATAVGGDGHCDSSSARNSRTNWRPGLDYDEAVSVNASRLAALRAPGIRNRRSPTGTFEDCDACDGHAADSVGIGLGLRLLARPDLAGIGVAGRRRAVPERVALAADARARRPAGRAEGPRGRRHGADLLFVRMPDLERLQPDAQPAGR